jgi:hypothetical protein
MGFVGAFLARMLSRRAVFLDGFSMGARLPGASATASAALGVGAFFGSTPCTFVLDGLVFFVLSMGSLGIFSETG